MQVCDGRQLHFQANLCEIFAEDNSSALVETWF